MEGVAVVARRGAILLAGILLVLLLLLQYRLWFGEGGVGDLLPLRERIARQEEENRRLAERNRRLRAEVRDLKAEGEEAIEERARSELGMIREDERFYQVVEPDRSGAGAAGDE